MKVFASLLAALLLTTASAQTKIGSVILTKPAQPAPTVRPPAQQATPSPSTASSTANVPAGWYEVRGRISAADTVNLPAGSSVSVTIEDLSVSGAARQLVRIQFKTARLSTPYQIVFNPVRLNTSHQYAVRATVTDASGKLLYASDASASLPASGKFANVNVVVRAVR